MTAKTDLTQAAANALAVQDACNLSGVLFSFARDMEAVNAAARELGEGTEWRNNHPIVRLYVDKLASLSGMQGTAGYDNFPAAYAWCKSQEV